MEDSSIKTYLGIDWGGKRIGLAIGDSSTKIASPYKTVGDINDVLSEIEYEEIDVVVIGKPLKMADVYSDLDKDYIAFVRELEERVDVPIKKIDERLSSKHADSLPGDKKTKANRDEIAAMLILQDFFDGAETDEPLF
ncbi:Holliday junction resolvase RuvX [Candidatus Parcubacteria bacterium]|nr:MAG: Holliday junction resolvase RuvX [Candidatus Parcubacteria bacterium]